MQWLEKTPIRVATHGCPQHLDELVAISLLRRRAAEKQRTVDVHFLARAEVEAGASEFDVLIDIGQQFDPPQGRFDHHQGGDAVGDRSSAGLIFDTLFADDPRRDYLLPIIRHVDQIDVGGPPPSSGDTRQDRGRGLVTISALLKAIGGFEHQPDRSQRCLEMIQSLVDSWLEQAESFLHAAEIVQQAEIVGGGMFLDSDVAYGPGLLEYLQEKTSLKFVGFPGGKNSYQVVAIRDALGHNRTTFSNSLAGATFVHPKGFMIVFPNREAAANTLRDFA